MKKKHALLPLLPCLFLAAFLLSGCGERESESVHEEMAQQVEVSASDQTVTLSPEQQHIAGLQLETVQPREIQKAITIPGKVEMDERRLAHLTARVSGRVEEVFAFLGDHVEKNAVLATIYSPDYVAAQAEFIQADERLKMASGRGDSLEVRTAKSILESARRKLLIMGAREQDISEVAASHIPKIVLEVRAPFAGTVIESGDILGHSVEIGTMLFHLLDISRVWVLADAYENDLASLEKGLFVEVEVPAYPGARFPGQLTTIFDVVDETSHTVKVRIEVDNPNGRLKPHMFATVHVQGHAQTYEVAVPQVAVQSDGEARFVFVSESDTVFRKRPVQIDRNVSDWAIVARGLKAGERIVTEGSFTLKAELLKSTMEGE